jgi:hypothetical protein
MNKKFLSAILFGALMVTSTGTFVSCKDYDDDIDRLDQEISNVKDAIKALEDKVGSGKYVESCTPFTDGNGGYEIKFSDGETIKLYNGAKGEQGEPGKPGTPGTPGTSADDYVVSVEEGESAYELVITYADGTKKTISMPKATSVVSGVKFIPTFLSEGEAARIHFPTIVTDSVAGKTEITGADWGTNNFSTFKIVYSGKADVKYQVNPNSVSFKDMEVVGFVRDTAEIWNYNTNNKNWELFNAGQKLYTDGKITVESYKEGHGMLNFRVKDWAFAEQSNLDERTVYSLRIKNNDQIVHSDFVPAKHEVILQKNVSLLLTKIEKKIFNNHFLHSYKDNFYHLYTSYLYIWLPLDKSHYICVYENIYKQSHRIFFAYTYVCENSPCHRRKYRYGQKNRNRSHYG